jgi:HK97 family phage major capsid protein
VIEVEELKELPQLTREIAVEMRPIPRKKRSEADADPPEATTIPAQEAAEKNGDEADQDRFEISISSEAEVPRWFGKEILDHSTSSVDLSRAESGLAFLVDHETGEQVGIVESIGLGERKLCGIVRFSRSMRAQEIKRDVQDGIRPWISVGYRVNEIVLERENDEGRTYRVTSWTPAEVSTVAVPADTTVGVGRSADVKTYPVQVRSLVTESAPKPQSTTTTEANMDPKQQAEIVRLGSVHNIEPEMVAGMIERGLTLDQASKEILAEVGKRASSLKPTTQPAAEVELTEKEQREYRLTRGVMTLVSNEENGKRDNCFELEVSQDVEKSLPSTVKRHGGLFVPYKIGIDPALAAKAERAIRSGMDTKTVGSGKELVFIEPGSFIDYLYNRMLVKQFGSQTISGLQANIAFPKQTGKSTGSWVAENPGVDVAETAPTLGQITMSPKTHQSTSSYSRQLLAQGVVDVDMMIRNDLAKDSALAIDAAALTGDGTNSSPTGIMHTTGVQAYTLVNDTGNAATPVWDDIVFMEETVEDVNADELGVFGWATTPGIKARLKLTPRLGNTIGLPVWTDGNTIDGIQAGATNQLPKNLTKGAGTNLSPLIYGCFGQMIVGLWGNGYELVVDPYRLKKQGMIELTTFVMADVGIRQAPAFVVASYCKRA